NGPYPDDLPRTMARARRRGRRRRLRGRGGGPTQEPVGGDLRRTAGGEAARREGLPARGPEGGAHAGGPDALLPCSRSPRRGLEPRTSRASQFRRVGGGDHDRRRDHLPDLAATQMPRPLRTGGAAYTRRGDRDGAWRRARGAARAPRGPRAHAARPTGGQRRG